MSELLYGDCLHQAHCASPRTIGMPSTTTFDLNRLSSSLSSLESSWYLWFTQFMATSGNYLSLLALLIFGLQFSVYLATGFRDSWAWNRCLALRTVLTNLRPAGKNITREETKMMIAAHATRKPDPNEEV